MTLFVARKFVCSAKENHTHTRAGLRVPASFLFLIPSPNMSRRKANTDTRAAILLPLTAAATAAAAVANTTTCFSLNMAGWCERVSIRSPASSLGMLVLVQRTIDAMGCPAVVSHLIRHALVTTIPLSHLLGYIVFSFPDANVKREPLVQGTLQLHGSFWVVDLYVVERPRAAGEVPVWPQKHARVTLSRCFSRHSASVNTTRWRTFTQRAMSLTKLSEYMVGRRRRRICLLELHWQPLAENNERRFRTSAAAAEADIECNCAKRNNGHPSVVQRDLWWGLALVLCVLGCLVFILSLFSLAFNQLKVLYLWAYIFQQQFTVSESLPSERVFTQRKVLLQFFFSLS